MQPPSIMPPVDPGWGPTITIVLAVITGAWAILALIARLLKRAFEALRTKVESLDGKVAAMESNAKLIDHDLKAVRQNQQALETMTEKRHMENLQSNAELKEFIADENREMRRRVDRLLERNGLSRD